MKTLVLMLALAAPVFSAEKAKELSKDELRLVEAVIVRPPEDVTSSMVNAFMALDLELVPAKSRQKAKAKRVQLHTLKKLADDKKRGLLRWPEKDCAIPTEAKSNEADVLLMAGYVEFDATDVKCVMDRTTCTERDLMCEFSLNIVVEEKKKVKTWRFFFHKNDPIQAVAAQCRKGTGGNTNFFGGPMPQCGAK